MSKRTMGIDLGIEAPNVTVVLDDEAGSSEQAEATAPIQRQKSGQQTAASNERARSSSKRSGAPAGRF